LLQHLRGFMVRKNGSGKAGNASNQISSDNHEVAEGPMRIHHFAEARAIVVAKARKRWSFRRLVSRHESGKKLHISQPLAAFNQAGTKASPALIIEIDFEVRKSLKYASQNA